MAMTYDEAVAYLEALIDHERRGFAGPMSAWAGLDTIHAILALLGDPHLGLRCVHIAGSKGKGSVAAMTEAILRAAGYRTGLFTSPHLLSPRERIRIAGVPISEETLLRLVEAVRPAFEEVRDGSHLAPPSFFEAYAAMAFLAFAAARVDVAVLETGLGGRLDATNVVTPEVCAITTICLEHMDILGDTLASIAAEKAGIVKPGVAVVVAPQEPEAFEVIAGAAAQAHAPLVAPPAAHLLDAPVLGPDDDPRPQRLAVGERTYDLALLGDHQVGNAAVAVALAEALSERSFTLPDAALATGLREVQWPGRLQCVGKHPRLLLDCAHAPAAARTLVAALSRHFRYGRLWLVLGMADDKDVEGFAAEMAVLKPVTLCTHAPSPRALAPEELARRIAAHLASPTITATIAGALEEALRQASPDDLICVTGSIYVVGEAMRHLSLTPYA
jgi:dihydrofolate synthase/folylpolyglutamate synthase